MTLNDLFVMERILLGDSASNSFFQPTELIAVNNASAVKVARDTMCLRSHIDIATTRWDDATLDPEDPRREGRYALPLDFLSLKDIELVDGDQRYPLAEKSYDNFKGYMIQNTPGRPIVYKFEYGATGNIDPPPGDIWLRPLPDKDAPDAYIIRMAYWQIPTPLASLDLTKSYELPIPMHMSIVFYACALLTMKDDDNKRYQKFVGFYNDSIKGDKELANIVDQATMKRIKSVY